VKHAVQACLEQAPPEPAWVADLQVVEGVLGQGGVNPILELRALANEHHSCSRKVALVAQLARGNPDRR
jgi:hypothetical protein